MNSVKKCTGRSINPQYNFDMRQTLEEAAIKAAEDCYEMPYNENLLHMLLIKQAFELGAEWQAKQSPWISVKERLPNNDENIFYTNHLSGALGVGFYVDEKWYQAYTGDDIYGITHWMPIPKFNV